LLPREVPAGVTTPSAGPREPVGPVAPPATCCAKTLPVRFARGAGTRVGRSTGKASACTSSHWTWARPCSVEVVAGAHQGIVDAQPGAAAAHLDQVLLQRLDVAVAQGARVAHQLRQLLHPLEAGGAGEGEGQLVVVEQVEDEDVVPAVAKHLQAAEQRPAVHEQVGDDHDHAAGGDGLGDPAEDLLDVGLLARPADVHPRLPHQG
jgi:hypothetical protein